MYGSHSDRFFPLSAASDKNTLYPADVSLLYKCPAISLTAILSPLSSFAL